ncbi:MULTISPECIES: aldose epimerase family protein [Caproicibacterium]|uniref:Aldose 1-epimerase n=1 Tax=Caproicibacterium lactatifermentans TaxID=2666138 RepID=A0A859DPW5_9FIRM|nr:aldose epimerase family protein [Caproicibacterium lactatifermentans]ARP50652.1 hypothetical protein B6259_07060 [Ruminococcaceae bacterium CPB6]MDD4807423.1 galactose mutarotase [Oscillospiraceae bacterium]QKN23614.1 galactose-1-epimerase [Caproicibacterium lactatifermentans]QKO29712.1 galactose-1-epimerase [Caproicibacterium lactatifermentans]
MSITDMPFGVLPDHTPVKAYTLKNTSGASLTVLTYGARIQSLQMPGRNGDAEEMVLGHRTLEEYTQPGDYLGAVMGRYANRIADGSFTIAGKASRLAQNEGSTTLHGGPQGFSTRVWRCRRKEANDDAPSITLTYESRDGEQGFPGTCNVRVTYCLTTDNAVMIDYRAESSRATYLNLTNHSYFNLSGSCQKDVLKTDLIIDADTCLEVDKDLLPTGQLLPIEDTAEDFRGGKAIGQDINREEPQLRSCGGYDHCFVLNGTGFRRVAEATDTSSGHRMLVFTDQPGMQLFTANCFNEGSLNRDGSPMLPHTAFCLETQHFPDSPHYPEFPSTLLSVGKTFRSRTIYKFELIK